MFAPSVSKPVLQRRSGSFVGPPSPVFKFLLNQKVHSFPPPHKDIQGISMKIKKKKDEQPRVHCLEDLGGGMGCYVYSVIFYLASNLCGLLTR